MRGLLRRRRTFTTGVAVVAGALVLASCIGFSTSVAIRASTTTNARSRSVLLADVNGDGVDDPLVVTSEANLVRMVPCGSGCFTRGESMALGAGGASASLATADFNGDHIADVAVAASKLVVYFGGRASATRTDGLVASDSTTVTTASETEVLAADLNGDGHADLAFFDGLDLSVAFGDGHGAFGTVQPVTCYCSTSDTLTAMVTGDFDHDGASEIAVLAEGDGPAGPQGAVDIWPFAPGKSHYSAPAAFYDSGMAAGDVNGDGRDDLVFSVRPLSSPFGTLTGKEIFVQHSTGAGFSNAQQVTANGVVGALALRDVDLDGHTDLLALDTTNGVIDWFQGRAAGDFTVPKSGPSSHEAGPAPGAFVLGSGAGGTKPDLLANNPTSDNARVSYLANASS